MPVEVKIGEGLHPEGLNPRQESLIMGMHELDAIRFGEFRWEIHDRYPEAPLMPIYTNFRMLQREPRYKSFAVKLYEDLTPGLKFDLIAGIPTAAIPFSSTLSDRTEKGHITPRMDSKTHGTGARVDGMKPDDQGQTALVLDDLASFFGTKAKALEIIRESGLIVTDVIVLMDYDLGASQEASKNGVKLHSSFTAGQMLDFSLRIGRIDHDTHATLRERFAEAQEFFRKVTS